MSDPEGAMTASARPESSQVGQSLHADRGSPDRPKPSIPELPWGMLGAMPELPEVEYGRQIAMKVAQGRRIVEARCADDPIVFEGVAPARFRSALVGRRVRAGRRHGMRVGCWL